ncbi:MAG: lytic transglycosylase domain-containing protein [Myxococcales bacterium]|nr:lytic transglycosylase domain-containing protein [Myxococcales bacterium]
MAVAEPKRDADASEGEQAEDDSASASEDAAADDRDEDVELLHSAIRARITVSVNQKTGDSIPAAHCRYAREGCERRLGEFAHYLVKAGRERGVDPWVMAAMAFRESGFNPFALGSLGEMGILQINPGRKDARSVRFIQDDWYRKRCRRQPGACQLEIVRHAAAVLARSLERCSGDMVEALGAYNTGRCGGNNRYAKRILNDRLELRRTVGLDPPNLAGKGSKPQAPAPSS